MKSVNLLFPHQLFPSHDLYQNGYPTFLIEEHLFFKEFRFHKLKLAYHRASMRAHAGKLRQAGISVQYIESTDPLSDIRKLIPHLAEQGVERLHVINPTDNWLEKRIRQASQTYHIHLTEYENPLFLNSREELGNFFRQEKRFFFQTTYYKQQRKKRGLLLDENGHPQGGKWTFDAENRKKYPKNKRPPGIHFPQKDQHWQEAVSYVQQHFPQNPGHLSASFSYPYTSFQATEWLKQFFLYRFQEFGPYEDAIVKDEVFLHHSVLTPMLNVGLISPEDVLHQAIEYAEKHQIPINSLEGFVRQITGWREFIRGMYECKGTESRNRNFWRFERTIPASFYDGSTGIPPIDQTIQKVRQYAYCHHIERLMILSNFMLLCEFHPTEVYRWFMELFIDAYDWVMVPNVYGMGQFADGGLFATKPYISGSNYLIKMGNYPKGEWQQTWDGLFWRFMHVHRDVFLKNPRLGMLIRTFDKMDPVKQQLHLRNAENFLEQLDQAPKPLSSR